MLIDLLNSQNYIMVNMDAIQIFGLNTAVYCAELLNVYKKAVIKKKLYANNYFKVDRDFIAQRTSLSIDEQLKCDANLLKVNIIKVASENPDIIYFDVEIFASLLSSEDVKLLDKVSEKVKVENPKGVKKVKQERIIANLKEGIDCRTPEVLFALRDWIDSIFAAGKGLSKVQVALFKDKIDDYCNGDLQKALDIIKLATIHNYIDCQWAINLYERGNKPVYNNSNTINNNRVVTSATRLTEQKITTNLGTEEF